MIGLVSIATAPSYLHWGTRGNRTAWIVKQCCSESGFTPGVEVHYLTKELIKRLNSDQSNQLESICWRDTGISLHIRIPTPWRGTLKYWNSKYLLNLPTFSIFFGRGDSEVLKLKVPKSAKFPIEGVYSEELKLHWDIWTLSVDDFDIFIFCCIFLNINSIFIQG